MEPITVPRPKLIDIITANRAKHVIAHESAARGYRVKVAERVKAAAKKALKLAQKGRAVMMSFHYPLPASHVKDYDRVIGMLKMDTSTHIKLDARDYDRYVKDRWEWSEEFVGTASMYDKSDPLAHARRRK